MESKDVKKVTVNLPPELYRRVKAQVAMEGKTVSGLTAELMSEYLKNAQRSDTNA